MWLVGRHLWVLIDVLLEPSPALPTPPLPCGFDLCFILPIQRTASYLATLILQHSNRAAGTRRVLILRCLRPPHILPDAVDPLRSHCKWATYREGAADPSVRSERIHHSLAWAHGPPTAGGGISGRDVLCPPRNRVPPPCSGLFCPMLRQHPIYRVKKTSDRLFCVNLCSLMARWAFVRIAQRPGRMYLR